jgi:hypothetical protein
MTTDQPSTRRAPGRWLYVFPALLMAAAGWLYVGQRANSSVGPLTADEAAGLEPATDQFDPKRFRVISDGVIEDTATGIRRRVTKGASPDIPSRFSEGVDLNDNLVDDRRDGVGPRPQRVLLGPIGLDAEVIPIGLDRNGALAVPRRADITGWWSGGAVPGEAGPTVIVGHYDSKVAAGVFEQLPFAKVGQSIIVVQSDGSKYLYRVTEVQKLKKSVFPTNKVYGSTADSTLRLITCGGAFDRSTGHYVDNLIVYAELVPLAPGRGIMLGYEPPEYFPVAESTLALVEDTIVETTAVSETSSSSTPEPTTTTSSPNGAASTTVAVATSVPAVAPPAPTTITTELPTSTQVPTVPPAVLPGAGDPLASGPDR